MLAESDSGGNLADWLHRRGDSCSDCVGPKGEDMSGGYYEAGGSFLKLGLVEAFLVRPQLLSGVHPALVITCCHRPPVVMPFGDWFQVLLSRLSKYCVRSSVQASTRCNFRGL